MTMPLVAAAVCGVTAGFLRAAMRQRRLTIQEFRWRWLIGLSVLLLIAVTCIRLPDPIVSAALLLSQGAPLVFACLNRRQPGLWLVGLGLALNLLVISLNGGLMPISPETIQALGLPPESWAVEQRLGMSKDVVRSISDTRLWLLSDWLVSPAWLPSQGAFSIGDVIIGAGLFWVLWSAAGPIKNSK